MGAANLPERKASFRPIAIICLYLNHLSAKFAPSIGLITPQPNIPRRATVAAA